MNDKTLENHLNSIKEGKEPIVQPNPSDFTWAPQVPNKNKSGLSLKQEIFIDIYKSISRSLGVLLVSFLYGFGIDALVGKDWNLLQIFGIGILFNHALTIFPTLIKKLFSKS